PRFPTRYPLLGGIGNVGTRDDEPPADAVFTRCRLSTMGAAALSGTMHHLLVNGAVVHSGGRAVGCLPHNLGEVAGAVRALLEQPMLPDDELVDRLPGPDFPTGGVLVSRTALRTIYPTGAEPFPVRGRATLETSSIGPVVVVSELPFTVRPATFIQDLIHVKRAGKWPEIVDILDESDERGLRIVVQVRTGADPERLLAALLAGTSF